MHFEKVASIIFLLLFFVRFSYADSYVLNNTGDVVKKADLITEANIISVEYILRKTKRNYAKITLSVTDRLKGESANQIIMRRYGITKSKDYTQVSYVPAFQKGDDVVIILKKTKDGFYKFLGLTNGTFHIVSGMVRKTQISKSILKSRLKKLINNKATSLNLRLQNRSKQNSNVAGTHNYANSKDKSAPSGGINQIQQNTNCYGLHFDERFYLATNVSWSVLTEPVYYNHSDAPTSAPNDFGSRASDIIDRIKDAFNPWNNIQHNAFEIYYGGINNNAHYQEMGDGTSVVDWGSTNSGVLAVTSLQTTTRGTNSGADILISTNSELDWNINPTPPSTRNSSNPDLADVLSHEFGHFLGLSHPDDAPNYFDNGRLEKMESNYISIPTSVIPMRSLADGDKAGAVFQHPTQDMSGDLSFDVMLPPKSCHDFLFDKFTVNNNQLLVGSNRTLVVQDTKIDGSKSIGGNGILKILSGAIVETSGKIYLNGSNTDIVENNTILSAENGLNIDGSASITGATIKLGSDATIASQSNYANYTISGSTLTNKTTNMRWGGIFLWDNATGNIDNCRMDSIDTSVMSGGFLITENGELTLKNSDISDINGGSPVMVIREGSQGNTGYATVKSNNFSNITGGGSAIYYQDGSDPFIYNNTIVNDNGPGIEINNASGNIVENTINASSSSAAIFAHDGATPDFESTQVSSNHGKNTLYNSDIGIEAKYSSSVNAGIPTNTSADYNDISNNLSYDALAAYNTTIAANRNWWGEDPPNNSEINWYYNDSSVEYNNWLSSDPTSPNKAIVNTEQTDGGTPNLPTNTQKKMKALWNARVSLSNGDYDEALDSYRNVLENAEKVSIKKKALAGIGYVYRDTGNEVAKDLLKDKSKKSGVIKPIALQMLTYGSLANNDVEDGLWASNNLLLAYNGTPFEKTGAEGKMTFLVLNRDYNKANDFLSQYKQKFGSDERVRQLQSVLSAKAVVDFDSNVSDNSDNSKNKTLETHAFPNPFNPSTHINYVLPEKGFVRIDIYNISGQRVARLQNGIQQAGKHTVKFNGTGLASGVYLYRLKLANKSITKKILMIK